MTYLKKKQLWSIFFVFVVFFCCFFDVFFDFFLRFFF